MRTKVMFVPGVKGWIPKPEDTFVTTEEPNIPRICNYVEATGEYLRYTQFDGHSAAIRIKAFDFIKIIPEVGEPVKFVVDMVGMDPSITPTIAEETELKGGTEK